MASTAKFGQGLISTHHSRTNAAVPSSSKIAFGADTELYCAAGFSRPGNSTLAVHLSPATILLQLEYLEERSNPLTLSMRAAARSLRFEDIAY